MRPVEVGDPAPDAAVIGPGGAREALSSTWRDRPAVLAFLRHFG